MNALDYAKKKVYLWQSSPVSGDFDITKYPFIRKPLLDLNNIATRVTVGYGPTQSFKSVFLQIATAYRLDMDRSSVLAVAQTDEDAKDWANVKLNPFLQRIPSLVNSLKEGRNSQKIQQWLWPSHELIISGPGENAQESKSVRFLNTDEAHRWCVAYPGALAALRNRMGLRWDRHELDVTTAANVGTEIDIQYQEGNQDEWHWGCSCGKLIWPLWTEESRKEYNGEQVFQWTDSQSETETLDSVRIVCPHCHKVIEDNYRNRRALDEGADYVTKNPGADISKRSFRYNCFAPHWQALRDIFAVYLNAINSYKMGNILPYEDWVKKRLVIAWDNQYPMLGDSQKGRTYNLGEIQRDTSKLRTMQIDYQAGKKGEGKHWWALVEDWEKNGNSKRVAYRKLFSWDECRALQLKLEVLDKHTSADCGHEDREVFEVCARYHWIALKSGDEPGFTHILVDPVTHRTDSTILPYSRTRLESFVIGKKAITDKPVRLPSNGSVPPGYAVSRLWSKPWIYRIMFELKEGNTPREYGIARDFDSVFIEQLHSYIPTIEKDKKSGMEKTVVWKRIKEADHGFVMGCQGLLMAIISGFFPLASVNSAS